PLSVGDTIHIKGHTTDFQQSVTSMQIEHQQIQTAKKGEVIGLKVEQKCHEKDIVYKVIP
ncbi:MAG: translation elongation factor-like protein, partial [candidate division WOR-3 bacterium]